MSPDAWSLYLKSLRVHEDSIYSRLFDSKKGVYLTSLLWDYSGEAPIIMPPKDAAKAKDYAFDLKNDETLEFFGDGINLWPSRHVVGSLNVLMLAMKSKRKTQDIGETMGKLSDALGKSTLASTILEIAKNPLRAASLPVDEAVREFTKIAGVVLQNTHDSVLSVVEGGFGAERARESHTETYAQGPIRAKFDFQVTKSA